MFLSHNYVALTKKLRLNFAHYFIIKVPSKWKLPHIIFNHSSAIEFTDFINLYGKCTAKPYSFLLNDATLVSDNLLHLRHNLLKRIQKTVNKTDDKLRDEKLQCNVHREAAKRSALSSRKIE